MPSGPGIRLDSGIYPGWTVPMEYDPLLAKLAVWGPTRKAAIARMTRALAECHIGGIKNNVAFFRDIMQDPEFAAGEIHTGFIAEPSWHAVNPSLRTRIANLARYTGGDRGVSQNENGGCFYGRRSGSDWLREGRSRLLR